MRKIDCCKNKSLSVLIVLAGTVVLGAGPAIASSDLDLDGTTPHGSSISNNMDPALIGTWNVLQVQLEGSAGQVMVFPTHGAQVTWLDSGSFKVDYTLETNGPRATDIVAGEMVSPTTATPVSTCKMQITGEAIGVVQVYWKENSGQEAPEMRARLDMSASTRPEVKCEGFSEVIGNMVTPPVGAGRAMGIGTGDPYVPYYYAIDLDNYSSTGPNEFTDLEIWSVSDNPTRVRYYMRKID